MSSCLGIEVAVVGVGAVVGGIGVEELGPPEVAISLTFLFFVGFLFLQYFGCCKVRVSLNKL